MRKKDIPTVAFSSFDTISQLSKAKSRSICPENPTGEAGGGARAVEGGSAAFGAYLGEGWKVNPRILIQPGESVTLAEIDGEGSIQQIWMTLSGHWRWSILRFYWDDSPVPSVECPAGDFFCMGWGVYAPVNSLPICVNPGSAFNSYWPMPFKKKARITLTNIGFESIYAYYQINYALGSIPDECGYFHTQFRRVNPLPYKEVYTILDGVEGFGHYVGTYMAWGVNNNNWWGEGEIKFYIDGDDNYPTICGTGTEDYFCGSYNFENKDKREYEAYSTAYAGLPQIIRPDGLYNAQQRFGMYRWHLTDPVRFEEKLKVTIQALGWRKGPAGLPRYLPLQDDIASVAYFYLSEPSGGWIGLPDRDALEVI